jgi:hypothetical protein
MSLEAMYNNATANSYVGTIRTRQAADARGAQLVNFMDGTRRNVGNNTADEFQTEFTRNTAGSYVAGGVPKHTGGSLTRWTDKAYKLAFNGEGPASLSRGYYTSQFRTAYNARLIHNYTPDIAKNFGTKNGSARLRITASPSGAPAGL